MNPIAMELSETTLKTPRLEDAKVFVHVYLEALRAIKDVNILEVLRDLQTLDKRFKYGEVVETFTIEKFNPNGYAYFGIVRMREIIEKGYVVKVDIMEKGV